MNSYESPENKLVKEISYIMNEPINANRIETIYHYTSLVSFKKIAKTEKMFLTDFRFLNDVEELTNAISIFEDCVKRSEGKYEEKFERILDVDIRSISGMTAYVSSYSSDPDNLLLWKYYARTPKNMGCNFSINVEKYIRKLKSKFITIRIGKVIYDDDKKREIMDRLIGAIYASWKKGNTMISDERFALMISFFVKTYGIFFKNSAFKDEREVRVVRSLLDNEDENIEFRIKNGVSIPYITAPILYDKEERLKMILNPKMQNADAVKISVIKFMEKKGFKKIDVGKSKIPLR